MEVLVVFLLYMVFSLVISLGAQKAGSEQGRREEKKQAGEILPVQEQREENSDTGMTRESFDEFPVLWDAFEKQLKDQITAALAENTSEEADSGRTKLASIYSNVGFNYWWSGTGGGFRWKTQLDEVFFENRYYKTIKKMDEYYNLDMLAAERMDTVKSRNAEEIYTTAIKPFLDSRKQELMDAFAEMAKELENPLPYTLQLPVDDRETGLTLGFRKRYKKRNPWDGMDGYTYSFNGRNYTDIRAFTTETIEKLSDDVSIARDTFGNMVLRRYREIPTFDSGDREWDSAEIEYLMFDGKDIHLIVMRGGYRIAHLIFFEKLLTADARMKPIFEKLGWPVDNITWI